MNPDRWQQISQVYHAALTREVGDRAKFLSEACAGDDALQGEVASLLSNESQAAGFLSEPVCAAAVGIVSRPAGSMLTGRRIGVYQIQTLLGAGGMGEVYRARDTKLNRDVALKVLPEVFVLDPDRLGRFKREAQVLASLNHPNIAAIYGLEESDSVRALVLELVEGPTLADRIAQGPMSLDDALPIAKQIADAIEAAHEQGVIHRDLKPANIKVRSDGAVKVLDFGLAKALEPKGALEASASLSPTITTPVMTEAGLILGTAAYMSPEQAKGRPVDKRSDVWALGAVLYEMFTGRRAFEGDGVSDTLAAVLRGEPDWAALSADVPAAIRALIRGCLEKDWNRRIGDISVALFILGDPASVASGTVGPDSPATIASRPKLWRRVTPYVGTWLVGAVMAGAAVWFVTPATIPPPRVSRFLITPPSAAARTVGGLLHDFALTPDGAHLVYVGAKGALFVRALDQLDATPLSGTGAPLAPFVSPDGQWIGFFDGSNELKKVAITGGPAVTLGHPDGIPQGASWGGDGTIIFATVNVATGLQRIAAAGGEPTVLTRPNRARGEADHLWPEILPGGQAALFTITATTGGLDEAEVAVLDLRTGTQTVLIRGGTDARYVASGLDSPKRAEREGGHLVYASGGTLRAVAFDLARLAVIGTPVPVLPQVQTTQITGAAAVAVAADGTLVYTQGSVAAAGVRSLVWVDRRGQETPIAAPPRNYVYPRLSPDGTRLALHIADQERDVWLWDLARAAITRVTFDPGQDSFPVWTPDGRRLFFSSDRAGTRNLFAQAADGTGALTRLTESPNAQDATSVSPDGTRLVFGELAPTTGVDVMQLRLDGTHAITPLVQTPFSERNGEVSPDGRWLAYDANDSGRFEIYVRPFPDVSNGHWQVSMEGGTRPLWGRDGHELFFLAPTGALMRVGMARGSTWMATAPTKLFEGHYGAAAVFLDRTYDVSPDGRRFLMIKPLGSPDATDAPASFVVVQHWVEELKRLVPTNR
jgi:serine/threonine-protein kinase